MAILAELDDQHARPSSFVAGKGVDLALDSTKRLIALILAAIDADDRLDGGAVPTVYGLEGVRDFADRGACPACLDRQAEQVAGTGLRRVGQRCQCGFAAHRIPRRTYPVEPGDLRRPHRIVVDI